MDNQQANQQVNTAQQASGGLTDFTNAMGDQGLTEGARARIERRNQQEYNSREAEKQRA